MKTARITVHRSRCDAYIVAAHEMRRKIFTRDTTRGYSARPVEAVTERVALPLENKHRVFE